MNESQVFAGALKRGSAAERAAYLDDACAGDARLRADVEALLRAHATDPDFLEGPLPSLGDTAEAPPRTPGGPGEPAAGPDGRERPGVVLAGRYTLLEEIGAGG